MEGFSASPKAGFAEAFDGPSRTRRGRSTAVQRRAEMARFVGGKHRNRRCTPGSWDARRFAGSRSRLDGAASAAAAVDDPCPEGAARIQSIFIAAADSRARAD